MAIPIQFVGPLRIYTHLTVHRPKRKCKKPRAYINSITSNGVTITGRIKKLELREGQFVTATVSPKTAAGHAANYETGSATWESSAPDVVSVEVDPANELKAKIKGLNGENNDSALITFRADGDPDADQTRDLIATLDVVCTRGEASVAEITTDTPQDV